MYCCSQGCFTALCVQGVHEEFHQLQVSPGVRSAYKWLKYQKYMADFLVESMTRATRSICWSTDDMLKATVLIASAKTISGVYDYVER